MIVLKISEGGGAAKKYNPNGKLWVWKYRYFIVFCYNGIRYKLKYLFRPLPKNVKGGPKLKPKNWTELSDVTRLNASNYMYLWKSIS